jgi:iron complex outermembrane recepter protein
MKKNESRLTGAFLTLVMSCLGSGVFAADPPAKTYQIGPQSVSTALKAFAAQADMQLIFTERDAGGAQSKGVQGRKSAQEALREILQGTGLEFEFTANNVVVVRKAGASRPPAQSNAESQLKSTGSSPRPGEAGSAEIPGAASPDPSQQQGPAGAEAGRIQVEEVVVTAQKRSERLQDVPVPVTVVDAAGLSTQDKVLLRDYYSSVPGLNVAPTVQSNQTVSIRGITTGTGNPTVAILIDDVPYGASTNIGGGRFIPEVDPGDLAHVEVLRGPQGTLYGASSLGGLLKFVTEEPSTSRLSGALQVGWSGVQSGDYDGYNLRGSVNAPLSDTFAIRASGFARREPGYIDNIRTDQRDVNRSDAAGGRLAALWRPSDIFSVKFSALLQRLKEDGQSIVTIGLPDLEQYRLAGTGWTDRRTQAYSATATARLGGVELTSLTGYSINRFSGSTDLGSELIGGFDGKKFTQELRLSMPIGARLDWLVGFFYTDERSELFQTTIAVNQLTSARTGLQSATDDPTTYREYAGFTDLTVHFTDQFKVQLGGREAFIRQSFTEFDLNAPGVTTQLPILHPQANAFTFLVTPQLQLSRDLMIYARLASGYRPGGANPSPSAVVPAQYDPDKTLNYELGIKADFLEHRVSLDASAYWIDWKDIQFNLLTATTPPTSYTSNGGRARSKGLELSAGVRPWTGMSIDGWVSLNNTVLTQDFPPLSTAYGVSGDRLPFSSRFSSHLSAEQAFPMWHSLSGFIGAAVDYVGSREGPFRAVALRQIFPAYAQLDVRTGVRGDDWSAALFVTNLTDRRGELSGGLGGLPANALVYTRPRTVGLTVSKDF